ncbi:MAG: HTH domain-containing protein [Candidatus Moranbacteria bacterium]|nr:HTH domain-containing protein [Candidatus Moranbacteria bacterium]
MKTSEKILDFLKNKGQSSGSELAEFLEMTDRAVRKQLKNLLESKKITKIGKPPKVFYLIQEKAEKRVAVTINKKTREAIDGRFLIITPTGERREGWKGFLYWCGKTKQPPEKTAKEYIKTLKKYDAFRNIRNGNLISGLEKMKSTFPKVWLDELFYLDFYSIERFGKTKLGQLLLYAKQSQNKKLIKELVADVKPQINFILKKYRIDGVGFVPPTVKREVQFMKELAKNLNLRQRKLSITKIKTDIIVPQKTLNKLSDRVENAQKTFVVNDSGQYNNILLIDDAVGSGATINEIASQIHARGLCRGKIIGLTITGSFKGFDVISEV